MIFCDADGGSERDRGQMHADETVRDGRLDNEQTSTSDMHSDTSVVQL